MPDRFTITLGRIGGGPWPSQYVAAYCLRGALVPRLSDVTGADDLHGSRYAIAVPVAPRPGADTLVAELSTPAGAGTDDLEKTLDHMGSRRETLAIGRTIARLAAWTRSEVTMIEPDSRRAERISVRFVTATTFAAGNRRMRAVADPALIVGSWASSWNGAAEALGGRAACPVEVITELGRMLEPVAGHLDWTTIGFESCADAPRTVHGFSGQLKLRLHYAASDESAAWLHSLARLAPYAGTGYHAQIGLGATEVRVDRTRSAGALGPSVPTSSADGL